ncbi:MAG TPA: mechanosensitive ion channel domain-containing protein, partial [Prolixibacteraceae bacterium]|nr:mechanosensitive ion channel domain-containing protein [Prolixibacteraceae bacterium]
MKQILFFILLWGAIIAPAQNPFDIHTFFPVDTVQKASPVADTIIKHTANIIANVENVVDKVERKPVELIDLISFTNIFWTIILVLIGYVLVSFVLKIMVVLAERSSRFRITIKSLIPLVRIAIWLVIIFIIIKGVYNPPIEMLLAVTASVAIAVGLAAQDLLKNVFGGIMLLFDRPFQVGDKIEVGAHYGEVIEIGLRTTRIV